jgi:hypothetical protein
MIMVAPVRDLDPRDRDKTAGVGGTDNPYGSANLPA